jgi:hypothetical protein
MKPRHAAALALVGWYLIVPYEGGKYPHFGNWAVVATFASRQSCEKVAADLRADAYGSSAVDQSELSDAKDPYGEKRSLKIGQNQNATCNEF